MQHFFELFLRRNSLSTVPSFQETFFFRRLSWRVMVCGGGFDGDGVGFSRVRVSVVVGVGGTDRVMGRAIGRFDRGGVCFRFSCG
ncbi:hypothetical protein LguiA_018813 [Lonicera macranthoides]